MPPHARQPDGCRRRLSGHVPRARAASQAAWSAGCHRALAARCGRTRRAKARCDAARRRRFESIQIDASAFVAARPPADLELTETLDQELSRLPSKYRSPIVLCYLEGQTHEEAARVLKWPIGTVKGRLARARDLLRDRLVRRGLAPTALAISVSLSSDASASLPRELLESTVSASLKSAIGQTTSQVVRASVASLVEGALTAMLLTKIKWMGAALVVFALALTGAGVMARQHGTPPGDRIALAAVSLTEGTGSTPARGANTAGTGAVASSKSAVASNLPFPAERPGIESEPANAESQLLQAAKCAWSKVYGEFSAGSGTVDRLHEASALLLDAQKQSATSPAETTAAINDHLDRIRSIARLRQNIQHGASTIEGDNAKLLAFAAKAELELAQGGGGFGGETAKKRRAAHGSVPAAARTTGHSSFSRSSTTWWPLTSQMRLRCRTFSSSSKSPRNHPR